MKDFVIMTDASCDLPIEFIEQYDIQVVPMTVSIGDNTYKHYHDYRELNQESYCNALRNGQTGSTGASNPTDIFEAIENAVKKNKDVLYLSLSSGLSCSYQNTILAADMINEEYPDANVHVIDTRSVCIGIGLLALLAVRAKENGASLEETIVIINDNIAKIKHYFTVDDLGALKRSGRISHLTALTGTLLNIKPMLGINEEGKIASTGKVRGRKMAIKQIVSDAIEHATNSSLFLVAHADAEEDAKIVREMLLSICPNTEVHIANVGPVIGVHVGRGTIACVCC